MPSPIAAVDLIQGAMRLAGILASGETATADEINDGLDVLNDVIEGWKIGTLSVWNSDNETFNTVVGQAEYTYGTGGDFNADRPVRISAAYTTVQGVDFPISLIALTDYDRLSLKTMQQQIVLQAVYLNEYPLGRVILWPVPAAVVPITFTRNYPLPAVASTSDVIDYPPGAAKALKYTLAIELAGEFGTPVLQTVVDTHKQAMADWKRSNQTPIQSVYDTAIVAPERAIWQRGF